MSSTRAPRRAVSSTPPAAPTPNTPYATPAFHSNSHMATSAPLPAHLVMNKTASRIITSVKRSFSASSPKRRSSDTTKSGMISTPEERSSPTSSPFQLSDPSSSRPSIEQIAMGLHVSRTPHLRPLGSQSHSYPQRNSAPGSQHHTNHYEKQPHPSTPPLILLPPPRRSSLKQPSILNSASSISPATNPGLSPDSASSTTVTSNMPPTPQSSNRSIASMKFRMSRFLPGSRCPSAPPSSSSTSSLRGSASHFQIPKKAVRFSTQVVELDE